MIHRDARGRFTTARRAVHYTATRDEKLSDGRYKDIRTGLFISKSQHNRYIYDAARHHIERVRVDQAKLSNPEMSKTAIRAFIRNIRHNDLMKEFGTTKPSTIKKMLGLKPHEKIPWSQESQDAIGHLMSPRLK